MRSLSIPFFLSASAALLLACEVETNPPPAAPVSPAPVPVTVAPPSPGPAPAPAPLPPAPGPAPSPAPVVTPAPPPPAAAPDAGAAAAKPDFYTCTTNADCVSVAKVGCCHNGQMEAIAKSSADAYAKSFVCQEKRPICPQYIVNETRVPACSPSLHKCELVGRGVYVK